MMNRRDGIQQKMLCVTLESLMPEKRFLRDLDRLVNFDFVYEKAGALYARTGRPSIDPVVFVKMMLLGYLYGIDSERKLEQEVRVNIAFRWFPGVDLDEPVPDHSTFSQFRRREFNGTSLFEEIFMEIVRMCIGQGLVDGRLLLTDFTHVRANVRNDIVEEMWVEDTPSEYIQRLNAQAERDGIMSKTRETKKPVRKRKVLKSPTDPDCGYMKRTGEPGGFYYLDHQTSDSKHGVITDVFVTPGNATDASVYSARIRSRSTNTVSLQRPSAPIPAMIMPRYTTICWQRLHVTSYRPKAGTKHYMCKRAICQTCPLKEQCLRGKSNRREIVRAYHKNSTDIQHRNNDTPEYAQAVRVRKIWCEGNFSHQKAHHNLTRVRKWGIGKAFEHGLLSATVWNLKRMVKLLPSRVLSFLIRISMIFTGLWRRLLRPAPVFCYFVNRADR